MSLRRKFADWKARNEQRQRERQREELVRVGQENAKLIAQIKGEKKRATAYSMREQLLQQRQQLREQSRGRGGSGWDKFDRGVVSFSKGMGRAVQSFDKAVDTLVPPTKSREPQRSMFDAMEMGGGGGGGFNPITGESYGGRQRYHVHRRKKPKHRKSRYRRYSEDRGFNPVWG
jgi:hypothetical protein